jgi:hypothetical protein
MRQITPEQIRSSFINASRSEAAKLNLPKEFDALEWDSLDFLGWRDHKMPLRGYLVVPGPGGLTGIMLRAPEGAAKKNRSVLCELCVLRQIDGLQARTAQFLGRVQAR